MDTSKVDLYAQLGIRDKLWYERAQYLFTDLYGADNLSLVTKLFAATSINTSMKSNITLFRRAYHEIVNGLPFSNYLPIIKTQLERVKNGRDLSGQKINAFANAMRGDVNAVVVDTWLLRAFGEDRKYYRKESLTYRSGGATAKQFNAIENYVRLKAVQMGIEPRQLSAMIWTGIRTLHSGDKESHYDLILRQKEFNMFNYEQS